MKRIIQLGLISLMFCMVSSSCFAECNNLSRQEKVPSKVYRLVQLDKGVSANYADDMKEILGLFWAEPNGQLILRNLCKHNVKIELVNSNKRATAAEEQVSIAYSPSLANQGDMYTLFYVTVSIPVNYLSDYENKNLSADKRLYSLGYILHELAHAYVYAKDPHNVNSIEQKLTLTMFGYNEASKILTGDYLSKDQSVLYSYKALESIVDYETKKFPIYSGVTKKLIKYGITLQNIEDYSDIVGMYKKLLVDGKIKPCVSFPTK